MNAARACRTLKLPAYRTFWRFWQATHRHTHTHSHRYGTSSSPRKQAGRQAARHHSGGRSSLPGNTTLIKNVVIAIHSCCKSRTLVACAYKADTHTHTYTHWQPALSACVCVCVCPAMSQRFPFPPRLMIIDTGILLPVPPTHRHMNWFRIPRLPGGYRSYVNVAYNICI